MPPMWTVEVRPRDELSDAALAEQRALGLRSWAASTEPDERYPFGITWAPPAWLALVRDADGRLVGRAGVLIRHVTWAGREVPIGGVSSVSTDPELWGRGIASLAVSRLMRFLCDDLHAHAGLLLASRMGQPVYARLGWRPLDNPVRCAQPDGDLVWTQAFPGILPMAWPCHGRPLPAGEIDLNGLPW